MFFSLEHTPPCIHHYQSVYTPKYNFLSKPNNFFRLVPGGGGGGGEIPLSPVILFQCVHHYVEVPVCPPLFGGSSVSTTIWRSQCVHHYLEGGIDVYRVLQVACHIAKY